MHDVGRQSPASTLVSLSKAWSTNITIIAADILPLQPDNGMTRLSKASIDINSYLGYVLHGLLRLGRQSFLATTSFSTLSTVFVATCCQGRIRSLRLPSWAN